MLNPSDMIEAAKAHLQQGDLAAAADLCRTALQGHRRHPGALQVLEAVAQGCASHGRFDETAACFELMLTQCPDSADLYFNLGGALLRAGDRQRAIEALTHAARCRPGWVDACYYLAMTLQEAGAFEQSARQWRRVLELSPDLGSAHFHLGVVHGKLGDSRGAAECFTRARRSPRTALLCNDLGLKSLEEGRLGEAIEDLAAATALDATFASAWMNLGMALMSDRRVTEALKCFETAIRLEPGRTGSHWHYATAMLSLGDYVGGLAEYEWRLRCPEFAPLVRKVARPIWHGEDLGGRTILLHDEQGFGDTIQFVRYAPLLADRGTKVVLLCKKDLAPLLSGVRGVAQVLFDGQPCPHVDFHVPIASLPRLFATTLNTIPRQTPYLSCDAALVESWARRLPAANGRVRVGIAWLGNARPNPLRSVPPELLAPLAELKHVSFHSLQKQSGDVPVRPPECLPIHDHSTQLSDFSDTAALIANMDLVISIDTAAAHLAAAMGMRTWVLLPYAADWRWLMDRDDSPWYPTARLFRQKKPGDWAGVIRRVSEELSQVTWAG